MAGSRRGHGADLRFSNLSGKDLRAARGLENALLKGAVWSDTTVWPTPEVAHTITTASVPAGEGQYRVSREPFMSHAQGPARPRLMTRAADLLRSTGRPVR